MLLFNEKDLFSIGSGISKNFKLPDLGLTLHEGFIPKTEADYYYDHLLKATPWHEYQMPMYDKIVTAPRMIAWYGTAEEAGETALPWTPELMDIKHKVQQQTGLEFNAVLLNLYRNGNDSVSWHYWFG